MQGFLLKEERILNDIACTAYLYEHIKTKAPVLYLKNQDKNKTFTLSFQTLPTADHGIAHILEHSVLNGSKKFPVKEPFVELLKTSFQNFLNAMTAQDKTFYPLASTNQKDFLNLMEVYLDGLFAPLLLENPLILAQEGWHYHLEKREAPLTYKGIVYNEMKGAYSSPATYLYDFEKRHLFEGCSYAFSSGGVPEAIPSLTQEEFVKFYKEHYHPSNAQVVLYGDMDLEAALALLDQYFSKYESKKYAPLLENIHLQEGCKEVHRFYPLKKDEPYAKHFFSFSFPMKKPASIEETLAFELLEEYFFGDLSSPLIQAFLKEKLAKKVEGSYRNSLAFPYFTLHLEDVNIEDFQKCKEFFFEILKKYRKEGFSKERLYAILQKMSFSKREFIQTESRVPKGILYAQNSFKSWSFHGNPWESFYYTEALEQLKEKIDSSYFENLIEQKILKNKDALFLCLEGKKGLLEEKEEEQAKKLQKIKAAMSENEIDEILARNKALLDRQMTPDSQEALASLPTLSLKDVEAKEKSKDYVLQNNLSFPLYFYEEKTAGITYVDFSWDTPCSSLDELPYLELFTRYLGEFDTEKYSLERYQSQRDFYTGGIETSLQFYENFEISDKIFVKVQMSVKCLDTYLKESLELLPELLQKTKWDNKERWFNYLQQEKVYLEQQFLQASHSLVLSFLLKNKKKISYLKDQCNLYGFYLFIKNLLNDFEQAYPLLLEKMQKFSQAFLAPQGLECFVLSEEKEQKKQAELLENFVKTFFVSSISSSCINFSDLSLPSFKSLGLKTSQEILFVGYSLSLGEIPKEERAKYQMLIHLLNLDYFWTEIRVKGGAYGAFAHISSQGDLLACSYRDPHLVETLHVYQNIAAYLEQWNCDEQKFENLLLGFLAQLDAPQSNRSKALAAQYRHYTEQPLSYEENFRKTLLSLKIQDLKELKKKLEQAKDTKIVVLGHSESIEKHAQLFEEAKELF